MYLSPCKWNTKSKRWQFSPWTWWRDFFSDQPLLHYDYFFAKEYSCTEIQIENTDIKVHLYIPMWFFRELAKIGTKLISPHSLSKSAYRRYFWIRRRLSANTNHGSIFHNIILLKSVHICVRNGVWIEILMEKSPLLLNSNTCFGHVLFPVPRAQVSYCIAKIYTSAAEYDFKYAQFGAFLWKQIPNFRANFLINRK